MGAGEMPQKAGGGFIRFLILILAHIGIASSIYAILNSRFLKGVAFGFVLFAIVEWTLLRWASRPERLNSKKVCIPNEDYNASECWFNGEDALNGCVVSGKDLGEIEIEKVRFKQNLEIKGNKLILVSPKIIVRETSVTIHLYECEVSLHDFIHERDKWNCKVAVKISSQKETIYENGNELYLYFPTRKSKEFWYYSIKRATLISDKKGLSQNMDQDYIFYLNHLVLLHSNLYQQTKLLNKSKSILGMNSSGTMLPDSRESVRKGLDPSKSSVESTSSNKFSNFRSSVRKTFLKNDASPVLDIDSTPLPARNDALENSSLKVQEDTEGEEEKYLKFTNYLIARAFWFITHDKHWLEYYRSMIQNGLNSNQNPLHGPVEISEFTLGNQPPIFNNFRDVVWDSKSIRCCADVEYFGGFTLVYSCEFFQKRLSEYIFSSSPQVFPSSDSLSETLSPKFPGVNIGSFTVKVRIRIRKIQGVVCLEVPSPPSDRLWMSFRHSPVVDLDVIPDAQEHLILLDTIVNVVKEKITAFIEDKLVFPNMEDFSIPLFGSSKTRMPPKKAAKKSREKTVLVKQSSRMSKPLTPLISKVRNRSGTIWEKLDSYSDSGEKSTNYAPSNSRMKRNSSLGSLENLTINNKPVSNTDVDQAGVLTLSPETSEIPPPRKLSVGSSSPNTVTNNPSVVSGVAMPDFQKLIPRFNPTSPFIYLSNKFGNNESNDDNGSNTTKTTFARRSECPGSEKNIFYEDIFQDVMNEKSDDDGNNSNRTSFSGGGSNGHSRSNSFVSKSVTSDGIFQRKVSISLESENPHSEGGGKLEIILPHANDTANDNDFDNDSCSVRTNKSAVGLEERNKLTRNAKTEENRDKQLGALNEYIIKQPLKDESPTLTSRSFSFPISLSSGGSSFNSEDKDHDLSGISDASIKSFSKYKSIPSIIHRAESSAGSSKANESVRSSGHSASNSLGGTSRSKSHSTTRGNKGGIKGHRSSNSVGGEPRNTEFDPTFSARDGTSKPLHKKIKKGFDPSIGRFLKTSDHPVIDDKISEDEDESDGVITKVGKRFADLTDGVGDFFDNIGSSVMRDKEKGS